jgi:hypothetical protein
VIIVRKVLCLFPHVCVAAVCIVLECLALAEQSAFGKFHCFHCMVFSIITDQQEIKMSESTDRTDCFISWVQIVIC